MPDYLGALGLLMFVFFLLATATEVILESFRNTLEKFGITPPKPKMSLEEAIKLSSEFIPAGSVAEIRVNAIETFIQNATAEIQGKAEDLKKLKESLVAATTAEQQSGVANSATKLVADINAMLNQADGRRIRALRRISIYIALITAWSVNLDAFKMMFDAYPEAFGAIDEEGKINYLVYGKDAIFTQVQAEVGKYCGWLGRSLPTPGIFITAFAAAGGSSYWHDQIDKVRGLKNAQEQLNKLTRG